MKKALVILMALAMVFAAFADDPSLVPAFSDFTGSASFGYDYDLDADAFGMTNAASGSITFSFAGEATKTTEGSGIWGELAIKSAAETCLSTSAVSVETAKIHFGDTLAINIISHDVSLGSNGPAFVTGDFAAATAGAAADAALTNGFVAEIALPSIANVNVTVADNGVKAKAQKEVAVKADVDVTAIDGVTLWGGVAYNGDLNDGLAFAAKAGYTLDKLTITAAFDKDYADGKSLAAGALYAWGGTAGHVDYMTDADTDNSVCTNGVSVGVVTTDLSSFGLGVGVFDGSFVSGLTFGAELIVDDVANFGTGTDWAAAAAKYTTAFGDINFTAHAGTKITLANSKLGFMYGASIDNSTFIQNTTLSLSYEGQKDAAVGGADKKGLISAAAKISF